MWGQTIFPGSPPLKSHVYICCIIYLFCIILAGITESAMVAYTHKYAVV